MRWCDVYSTALIAVEHKLGCTIVTITMGKLFTWELHAPPTPPFQVIEHSWHKQVFHALPRVFEARINNARGNSISQKQTTVVPFPHFPFDCRNIPQIISSPRTSSHREISIPFLVTSRFPIQVLLPAPLVPQSWQQGAPPPHSARSVHQILTWSASTMKAGTLFQYLGHETTMMLILTSPKNEVLFGFSLLNIATSAKPPLLKEKEDTAINFNSVV